MSDDSAKFEGRVKPREISDLDSLIFGLGNEPQMLAVPDDTTGEENVKDSPRQSTDDADK